MKKYDIKQNRPELSKIEIEQGMDFGEIRARAAAGPGAHIFSLRTLLVAGIAAAAAVMLTIYWPSITGQQTQTLAANVQLPNKVNIPDTFVISTHKDTTLVYNSGSRIKIAAGTFVDAKGEPVKGKVKINYREFHKVSEIFLANIPMRYDSGGKEMYFESAGMFDISAKQNGEPVYIAHDKSLEVSLATLDRAEKKYNQYLLDEKTGQWKFIKRDEVAVISKTDMVRQPILKVDSVIKTAPVKPVNERMFTIDATGRPELEVYKGIVFEVTRDCKTFNPEEAKTDWGMVNVQKIARTDKYKVTFSYPLSGALRSYEVTARPVKDGNMESAMKKYDELYAIYKRRLEEAQKADQVAGEILKTELAAYEDVFQKYQALQERNAKILAAQMSQNLEISQVVYRTFQVKQFGIWNSDCPLSMPQGMEVFASFEGANGQKIKASAVYLVEKGKNALYNLYVPKKFSFNPDAENVLLVVTTDGKLGWVKNEVFKAIDGTGKNFTFKLNMLNKDSYTLADVDNIVS